MNSTWMSNIMRGTRVGSGKFGEVVESASVAKVSCWKGCAPKAGTPKTKESDTIPGKRVNNCDCG